MKKILIVSGGIVIVMSALLFTSFLAPSNKKIHNRIAKIAGFELLDPIVAKKESSWKILIEWIRSGVYTEDVRIKLSERDLARVVQMCKDKNSFTLCFGKQAYSYNAQLGKMKFFSLTYFIGTDYLDYNYYFYDPEQKSSFDGWFQ